MAKPSKPSKRPGDNQQSHLKEPKHLKQDNPGPSPQPPGCTCTWTAGSVGWFRGANSQCTVSH